MALSDLLRSRGRTLADEDARAIDRALSERWQAASQKWPEVRLDLERFAGHLAPLLPDEFVAPGGLAALHCDDLYLAAAATAGDSAALVGFDAHFLSAVARYVARVDAAPEFADEVRQMLRERLLVSQAGSPPRIAGYSGQGPLGGWVRMAAVRVALNLRRGPAEPRPIAEILDLTAAGHSPELALIVARSRSSVEDALRAAFAGLDREDRALLRLHLLEDLSIDALAELYQIHRSTAARRIAACRQTVVDETLGRLAGTLQLSPSELASLVGLVRSRIELSLHELLATLS